MKSISPGKYERVCRKGDVWLRFDTKLSAEGLKVSSVTTCRPYVIYRDHMYTRSKDDIGRDTFYRKPIADLPKDYLKGAIKLNYIHQYAVVSEGSAEYSLFEGDPFKRRWGTHM